MPISFKRNTLHRKAECYCERASLIKPKASRQALAAAAFASFLLIEGKGGLCHWPRKQTKKKFIQNTLMNIKEKSSQEFVEKKSNKRGTKNAGNKKNLKRIQTLKCSLLASKRNEYFDEYSLHLFRSYIDLIQFDALITNKYSVLGET